MTITGQSAEYSDPFRAEILHTTHHMSAACTACHLAMLLSIQKHNVASIVQPLTHRFHNILIVHHVTTQWPQHALHATPPKHQCQSPENAVRLKVWHHHHISHISYTRCEPSCVSTSVQLVQQHALHAKRFSVLTQMNTHEYRWQALQWQVESTSSVAQQLNTIQYDEHV